MSTISTARARTATATALCLFAAMLSGCDSEQPFSIDWLPDPAPGIRAAVYDEGPAALTLFEGSEEVHAAVYFPEELSGHEHVILLQHGGRQPCTNPVDSWPCRSKSERTPSFLGFGYLGTALAEQGNIVVSISANSTVARANTDQSGVVFNRHLQLWQDWNRDNSGPFGDRFTGQLDLSSIGMIGHSRGGDAAARYASDEAGVPPSLPISAIVLFAPVLPITGQTPDLPPIPTVVTEGTCDGDVGNDPSGYVRDKSPESDGSTIMITVAGANHNFFNTEWSPSNGRPDGIDDGNQTGNPRSPCALEVPRLTETEQRTLAVDIATRTFNAAAQDISVLSALSTLPSEFPYASVQAFG